MKPAWRKVLIVTVILVGAMGCGPKSKRGESCTKTSDCHQNLACLEQTCRDVLADARDQTLDAINWMRTSEKGEHMINEAFVAAPACPTPEPSGMKPVSFILCREEWPKGVFMHLPPSVRCQYSIEIDQTSDSFMDHDFTVKASCDFDGDGERALYVATRADEAKATTPQTVY